jgi:LmbE family N-acetylglucosaminyl deacetylase
VRDEPQRQVLVLAPHPDDEAFGCGGTIRALTSGGTAVDVAFVTRGELGAEGASAISADGRTALAERRTREAQAACNILGVRSMRFLNGTDLHVGQQPELAAAIEELLRQTPYQRVFCPWPHDAHADHQATFIWLRKAVNRQSGPTQFWLYEVWKPLAANTFVPIDGTIDAKLRAIEQYPSQLSQGNYREAFLGLASYRSLFCPPCKFAEAFFVCSQADLLRLNGAAA